MNTIGTQRRCESPAGRCLRYRKKILEMSQKVTAAHVGSAFSCIEIVDLIYNSLIRRTDSGETQDTFLMSKGHGCLAQYVVLNDLGVLSDEDLDDYCTSRGMLGAHPDYGVPGIEASTGSLGHGLGMAVGMGIAERNQGTGGVIYVVLSDGELQEGSTWEAIMLASSLRLTNLTVFVDNNDYQSLGKISLTHPSFYPLVDKFRAFGWEAEDVDGHDSERMRTISMFRTGIRPFAVCAKTVKGKGVSFMQNNPIWHYRRCNDEEYALALKELENDN